jgi:oxygen-independent coproporphyrinogen-3 oxidase|tara:strand:- start:1452 stop:2612 length:1161 start_codon:yes stop_codon:yes gene_type:complete
LTSEKLPLGLYIHFPWCVKKCPYCDFNSFESELDQFEQIYIAALKADLRKEHEALAGPTKLQSIFMGGGTPSLFSPSAIGVVLDMVSELFTIDASAEITLEANPGTTDQASYKGYYGAGVNRISIGVQSFHDSLLQQLGRIHSANDALEAFAAARNAGFSNINIDLMHGLPGQTLSTAMKDLEIAISLQSEHLSWYQLTIEPNTYFYKFPPKLPDEDQLWLLYEHGLTMLKQGGFDHYEISAFSKPSYQCQHNKNYWQFGDYLGIGAGAHGKISENTGETGAETIITRTTKTRSPADYMLDSNRQQTSISRESLLLEFMMNSLRLKEGFMLPAFENRTGLSRDHMAGFLQAGFDRQLLRRDSECDEHILPTDLGMRYLDDLLLLID